MNEPNVIKESFKLWWANSPGSNAAAIAFYMLFALPSVIVIVITVLGYILTPTLATGTFFNSLQGIVGLRGTQIVYDLVTNTSRPATTILTSILTFGAAIVGAVGLFSQIQSTLHSLWEVRERQGLHIFLREKLGTIIMLVLIGGLLIFSLSATAFISTFYAYLIHRVSLPIDLISISNSILSFILVSLLFMGIYAFLPRIRISRRAVLIGGLLTALLFFVGRIALTYYLGSDYVASAYGTTNTLIILLLWIYYSTQVFLFGAATTHVIDQRLKKA